MYPSGKVYVAAVRLERVVLTCELCRPWAEVRWTKDGEEVVESPALLLQKEDTIRRLVLPAVQLEDSGEYLCEIDDESASFTVTVTGVGPSQLLRVTRGQPQALGGASQKSSHPRAHCGKGGVGCGGTQ